MTKRELLAALEPVPMDAIVSFSMDVSEPGHEGLKDEEANAEKRAFGGELTEVMHHCGDYVVLMTGELNFSATSRP